MAYCSKCGKEVEAGDTFCHACGASIVRVGEAPGSMPAAAGTVPVPPVTAPAGESPQEIAERRVKERMELWWHLGSYVIVNAFLVIIWAITGAGYPWFIWVMMGWGVGVAFHIMHYLITMHGESRREHMVQKELDKLQRKQVPAEEPELPEEG